MKYELIVSDLDGTALKSDKTASERTREAIRAYQNAGGIFIISTGRMFESAIQVIDRLGLDELNAPICAMDGGIIRESKTRKIIDINVMPYLQVADFAKECERIGVYFQVYGKDKLYVSELNEINRKYCAITKVTPNVVGRLSDYVLSSKLECVKVLISSPKADEYLPRFIGKYDGIQFFLSDKEYLDGASINAGKGNALKRIAKLFGIDIAKTVAIGDSMNDVSMITEAGLGVAVNNADERLKKVAKLIAPSNDDDGLAYLIEKAMYNNLP